MVQLDPSGLSPRAARVIKLVWEAHPELRDRDALLAALYGFPQLFIVEHECGEQTNSELCTWVGFPYEGLRRYGWHRYRQVSRAQQLLRALNFTIVPPVELPADFVDRSPP